MARSQHLPAQERIGPRRSHLHDRYSTANLAPARRLPVRRVGQVEVAVSREMAFGIASQIANGRLHGAEFSRIYNCMATGITLALVMAIKLRHQRWRTSGVRTPPAVSILSSIRDFQRRRIAQSPKSLLGLRAP